MGEIRNPEPALLFAGFIGAAHVFPRAKKILEKKFGPLLHESEITDFTFTDYYEREMGRGLKRRFLFFGRKIAPDALAAIKLWTNSVEKKFSAAPRRRRVNIDPGYLTLSKVVLATTKDYQHRVYLGRGIFAEVTLRYQGNTFTPWEWTYPDYRSAAYIALFNRMRRILAEKERRCSTKPLRGTTAA